MPSDKEPKTSRARLQTHQHLNKTSQVTTQTFGPFQDHQTLPKAKIDLEKHVVNVYIEITQKSVNALSGSESPFGTSIIHNHKKGPYQGFLKD